MMIYAMTATFGKLQNQTLTLKPGLNILEAPNEWGKSTWCAFLVAMLYGIDSRAHATTKTGMADKTRYEPWSGQPMSGRSELCWNGRDITIERTGTKRGQFRQFRAFETTTGLPIPELTAENCGQMLLGVEKEVFQRAGFIRLSDMPVTQNEALRRRLNALVTTGDESGSAETLSLKLAKLKNACQSNSKNGLLPKAEAEAQALADDLIRLQQLRTQHRQLQTRQQELQTHLTKLRHHRQMLQYQSSQQNHQRLAEARRQEAETQAAVESLEIACRALPNREDARRTLTRLEDLRSRQQALYLEMQMLPPLPELPKPPAINAPTDPDALEKKLQTDLQTRQTALAQLKKKAFPLWLIGLLLLLPGVGVALWKLLPGAILAGIGLAVTAAGILVHSRFLRRRQKLHTTLALLENTYGTSDPHQWKQAVDAYLQAYQTSIQSRARNDRSMEVLRQQQKEVEQALQALCGENNREHLAATLRHAIAQWDALGDARREHLRAAGYVQSLQAVTTPLSAPLLPDELTHSEADTDALISDCETRLRQLQQESGRCMGQMEALGEDSDLAARAKAAQDRVVQLRKTLSAILLAQNTLVTATAQLQSRFAPRITMRTKELFSRMTGNRYDRLSFNQDLSLDVGAQGEDILRTSLWRSDGTVDQLYLALRLAVAEALTPNAPLVLDDALVRFDDTRLKSALEILQDEAQQRQILLFTCQSREQAALREGGVL